MFVRALFAFLALPGVVAFAVPIGWLVATSRTQLVYPLGRSHARCAVAGILKSRCAVVLVRAALTDAGFRPTMLALRDHAGDIGVIR